MLNFRLGILFEKLSIGFEVKFHEWQLAGLVWMCEWVYWAPLYYFIMLNILFSNKDLKI